MLRVLICTVHLTVCYYHARTRMSKNLLLEAGTILSDSNGIRIHNYLVRKRTLNFKLDIRANYKVSIHSETRAWHDNNVQLMDWFLYDRVFLHERVN